jgi:hypothetical protein
LVTPSTSRATLSPNRPAISSRVASVSSIVSCSRPVTIDAVSSFISARMPATSTGWEKYGSPRPQLGAVLLQAVDVGAIQHVLVRIGS